MKNAVKILGIIFLLMLPVSFAGSANPFTEIWAELDSLKTQVTQWAGVTEQLSQGLSTTKTDLNNLRSETTGSILRLGAENAQLDEQVRLLSGDVNSTRDALASFELQTTQTIDSLTNRDLDLNNQLNNQTNELSALRTETQEEILDLHMKDANLQDRIVALGDPTGVLLDKRQYYVAEVVGSTAACEDTDDLPIYAYCNPPAGSNITYVKVLNHWNSNFEPAEVQCLNGSNPTSGIMCLRKNWTGPILDPTFDGFEDGDYTQSPPWSIVSGNPGVQGQVVKNGAWALKATRGQEFWAYTLKNGYATKYNVWINLSDSSQFASLQLFQNTTALVYLYVYQGWFQYADASGWHIIGGARPTNSTWYRFEIQYEDNATKATYTIYDMNNHAIAVFSDGGVAHAGSVNRIYLKSSANSDAYFDDISYLQ